MNHSDKSNPEDTSEELEVTDWTCDICDTVYSNDNSYEISGYHEKICGQCYDRGLMWCIREAWKWRSQIRIDVLRKPRDE